MDYSHTSIYGPRSARWVATAIMRNASTHSTTIADNASDVLHRAVIKTHRNVLNALQRLSYRVAAFNTDAGVPVLFDMPTGSYSMDDLVPHFRAAIDATLASHTSENQGRASTQHGRLIGDWSKLVAAANNHFNFDSSQVDGASTQEAIVFQPPEEPVVPE